jgi:hypothetical protein
MKSRQVQNLATSAKTFRYAFCGSAFDAVPDSMFDGLLVYFVIFRRVVYTMVIHLQGGTEKIRLDTQQERKKEQKMIRPLVP